MGLMSDFVKAGDVIKKDIELAATDAEKALAFVQKHQQTILGLANLGGPIAETITSNALNLYDTVTNSVQQMGVAAAANGVSVTLDQSTLQSILADIAAVKGFKA
jgi:thiamine pyrophosphokinase